MKGTFETNLADLQKKEQANQKEYEDLKAAKTKEIQASVSILRQDRADKRRTDPVDGDSDGSLPDTSAEAPMDSTNMLNSTEVLNSDDAPRSAEENKDEEPMNSTEMLSSDDAPKICPLYFVT